MPKEKMDFYSFKLKIIRKLFFNIVQIIHLCEPFELALSRKVKLAFFSDEDTVYTIYDINKDSDLALKIKFSVFCLTGLGVRSIQFFTLFEQADARCLSSCAVPQNNLH